MPTLDFDHLARLARDDPAAFEAERLALLEQALSEIPAPWRDGARARLAGVQVRLAAARSPAERIALAFAALDESVRGLQALWTTLTRRLESPGRDPGPR